MVETQTDRRLASILAVDVVGYSRMISADEAGTLAAVRSARREILDPSLDTHGGRVFKTTGDGLLAEFSSAVDALRCAIDVQTRMASHAGDLNYRIGVNVGDVVFEDGDVFGDGVNIAARLETVADPGGIAISGATHEYTAGRIDAEFTDGGIRELKNIDRAVQVWLWSPNTTREAENIPPTLPDLPSIVVLPFDNMSGDPGQEYIADGVAEALTAALSRIRAFFVIARNSAFAYKGRATNVQEIGRDLGVAYVLEGSVQ